MICPVMVQPAAAAAAASPHASALIVVDPNPDVRVVQVTPSGEVASFPLLPPQANRLRVGDQPQPWMVEPPDPDVRLVHVVPSGEV